MRSNHVFKWSAVTLIWVWLAVFALIPNLLVFFTSFLEQGDNELVRLQVTLQNYWALFDPIYLKIFLQSFYIAGFCTLICLVVGYPFAYILARSKNRYKKYFIIFGYYSFLDQFTYT